MEEQNLKTCQICFKEIDSRAKKCPYCHHWQGKIRLLFFHPAFSVVLVVLALFAFEYLIKDQLGPGEDFASHKGQVKITETEMKFGENKCGPVIMILGKIKNDSSIYWLSPQFEVKFFDKDKNLIDTNQDEKYSFEIPANESIPFKLSIQRQLPEENYSSYEVRILSAKERNFIFN